MDYKALLENSLHIEARFNEEESPSRLAYLSEHIFDFTTDDDEMSELFATKALEVCRAITLRTTFEYIKNQDDYLWFLLMCNMPFFSQRIDCGTSIRGSFWSSGLNFELKSCGLWVGQDQLPQPLRFGDETWNDFILAMIEFVALPD